MQSNSNEESSCYRCDICFRISSKFRITSIVQKWKTAMWPDSLSSALTPPSLSLDHGHNRRLVATGNPSSQKELEASQREHSRVLSVLSLASGKLMMGVFAKLAYQACPQWSTLMNSATAECLESVCQTVSEGEWDRQPTCIKQWSIQLSRHRSSQPSWWRKKTQTMEKK